MELWDVNFTLLGNQLFFDQQGDMPMFLDIIQWQWDLRQNPFQSIAFYSPTKQRMTYIHNVSWHTPNNTVSWRVAVPGGLSRRALRDASVMPVGSPFRV